MSPDTAVSPCLPPQFLSGIPPLLLQHLHAVELNRKTATRPETLLDTIWLVLTEGSTEPALYGRNLIFKPVILRLAETELCTLLMERSATLTRLHRRRRKMHRLELEEWTLLILEKRTFRTRLRASSTANVKLNVGCKCSSDTEQIAHLNRLMYQSQPFCKVLRSQQRNCDPVCQNKLLSEQTFYCPVRFYVSVNMCLYSVVTRYVSDSCSKDQVSITRCDSTVSF